jgi:hypothetical protein
MDMGPVTRNMEHSATQDVQMVTARTYLGIDASTLHRAQQDSVMIMVGAQSQIHMVEEPDLFMVALLVKNGAYSIIPNAAKTFTMLGAALVVPLAHLVLLTSVFHAKGTRIIEELAGL